MGHPAIEAEIAAWTDETVIELAQKCRVQMDKDGKLIREFAALEAAGSITGENPYIATYNTACECYAGLKSIMHERGINPAHPRPRTELCSVCLEDKPVGGACPKEDLHNEDYG